MRWICARCGSFFSSEEAVVGIGQGTTAKVSWVLLLSTRAINCLCCPLAWKLNSCHHSEGRSPVPHSVSPVIKAHRLPYWAECDTGEVEWLAVPSFLRIVLPASHRLCSFLVLPFFHASIGITETYENRNQAVLPHQWFLVNIGKYGYKAHHVSGHSKAAVNIRC